MMKTGVRLWWLSVFVQANKKGPVNSDQENLTCKKSYELDQMENRSLVNDFCMDHSKRTCCSLKDSQRILSSYETLRSKSEFASEQCQDEMQNVMCAVCDPDMVSTDQPV